jgi:hypothetical protein
VAPRGCDWPGGQALAVYYDAAEGTRYLGKSESELRCDEDPVLFHVPTPLALDRSAEISWARQARSRRYQSEAGL